MPEIAIAVEQLSHRYSTRVALTELNLSVRKGALVGLLGPNGSGKSTLLGVLSTRLALQQGKVHLLGMDLQQQLRQIRGQIGVVFQHPSLDRRLSVAENLRYAGQIYGISAPPLQQRIQEVLACFRLEDRVDSLVETLSGGLARRVELAKCLLHRPQLILLDEPSTGLDPAARRDLWNALEELRRQSITTLVTTHLAEEGERCDEVHILHQGRLVASGSPQTLQQAVGHEVLTLQSSQASQLMACLQQEQGLQPRAQGDRLLLESESGIDLLADLLKHYRPQIDSATLSRPTLEDVFFRRTGESLQAEPAAAPSLWPEKRR